MKISRQKRMKATKTRFGRIHGMYVDNEWMKWMFKTSKWKPKVQISAKYDPRNTYENIPNI